MLLYLFYLSLWLIYSLYFNHSNPQIKSGLNGIKIFVLTLGIEIEHLCMCVYISPWPKPILVVNNFPFPYHLKDIILNLKKIHITFTHQVFDFLQVCDIKNFLKIQKIEKIVQFVLKRNSPFFVEKWQKFSKKTLLLQEIFCNILFSYWLFYGELAPTIGPSSLWMRLVSGH